MKKFWSCLVVFALGAVTLEAFAFTPQRAECIAPAGLGGAWDFTCRAVVRTMLDLGLVPQVSTTNLAGNGGGVAFSSVVSSRMTDANLIVTASTSTTLRLAQHQFGPYSENDVRWLAAIAADYGVITVSRAAPWSTLEALLRALRTNPEKIVFGGGSAVGGQDHMKVLVLARAAGIDPKRIRYQAFDGGGQALKALLQGIVQVFPGDASEVGTQLQAGKIRALAVQSPRRLSGVFARVPTVKELGFDAEWVIWRGFFVPKNMPSNAYDFWVNALRRVERSSEWASLRQQHQIGRAHV